MTHDSHHHDQAKQSEQEEHNVCRGYLWINATIVDIHEEVEDLLSLLILIIGWSSNDIALT